MHSFLLKSTDATLDTCCKMWLCYWNKIKYSRVGPPYTDSAFHKPLGHLSHIWVQLWFHSDRTLHPLPARTVKCWMIFWKYLRLWKRSYSGLLHSQRWLPTQSLSLWLYEDHVASRGLLGKGWHRITKVWTLSNINNIIYIIILLRK